MSVQDALRWVDAGYTPEESDVDTVWAVIRTLAREVRQAEARRCRACVRSYPVNDTGDVRWCGAYSTNVRAEHGCRAWERPEA